MNKTKSVRIMCPYCFNLSETIEMSYNCPEWCDISPTATVYEATCPECKLKSLFSPHDFIELDDGIADTISILNKKGYLTEFCCEGHGKYDEDDANIVFKAQPNLINKIVNLPDGWNVEDTLFDSRVTIIHDYSEDKQYLKDIQKWAEELPSLMEE